MEAQNESNETARSILLFIKELLPDMFGKKTLSVFLSGSKESKSYKLEFGVLHGFGALSAFAQEQISGLIEQLIEQGYLRHVFVGISNNIPVLTLTEHGLSALSENREIKLTLPKIYSTDFTDASSALDDDSELLKQYADVKRKLAGLVKEEETLKNKLKELMLGKKLSRIDSPFIELLLKEREVVNYPKEDVEKFVPGEILERIRKIKKIIVLVGRLK